MNVVYVVAAVLAAIVGLVAWAYRKGRKEARQETALEAAERIATAHKIRRDIDDEVADDPDLAARARRIGLQRGPGQ